MNEKELPKGHGSLSFIFSLLVDKGSLGVALPYLDIDSTLWKLLEKCLVHAPSPRCFFWRANSASS